MMNGSKAKIKDNLLILKGVSELLGSMSSFYPDSPGLLVLSNTLDDAIEELSEIVEEQK